MGTRISQKMAEVKKVTAEVKGVITAGTRVKEAAEGDATTTAAALTGLAAGALSSASVPKYKIDSSMVYNDSDRREYSLTFNLAVTHADSDPQSAVFDPVRKFEEYSCAQIVDGTLVDIQFPAIFKIYS